MAKTNKAEQRANVDALLADEYLSDLVYDVLLARTEPSKVAEITDDIANPHITFPAVRRIVADSPRFLILDRMWDIAARYPDQTRPTERTVIEILRESGRPMSTEELATELSIIFERGPQTYLQLLPKLLANKLSYFKTLDNRFGLVIWLPLIDAEEEEDVLSDNHLSNDLLRQFRDAAGSLSWSIESYVDTTVQIAESLGELPLPHHIAGILAWQALRGKYDSVKHLQACLSTDSLVWVTGPVGGRWITRAHADRLELAIQERAATLGVEDAEEAPAPPAPADAPAVAVKPAAPIPKAVKEAVSAPVVEAAEPPPLAVEAPVPVAEPEPTPLDVTEADRVELERIIAERGGPVDVAELLSLRYEVVPGDPSFTTDVRTLETHLASDDRFLSVGAGRFRETNSLPLFVFAVPEFLQFADLQFVSRDGEIMDEEIEDEGFVGSLRVDVLDPLAQDVGDDEGRYTGSETTDPGTVRLVVKAHHKDIGTFPLCQIPDGFFPSDAPVVEVSVKSPDGESHDIIVNNTVRLAFNLFGLYEMLTVDSGGVFLLHKGARPYEYVFEAVAEPDSQIFIAPERLSELQSLRESAEEGGDMATFDISCEILANYPKGLTFVQALAEVNIVRRVTRRKLASILSNYSCFMQKAGTDQWRFDPRKRDQGTDRTKRKYIKR